MMTRDELIKKVELTGTAGNIIVDRVESFRVESVLEVRLTAQSIIVKTGHEVDAYPVVCFSNIDDVAQILRNRAEAEIERLRKEMGE